MEGMRVEVVVAERIYAAMNSVKAAFGQSSLDRSSSISEIKELCV